VVALKGVWESGALYERTKPASALLAIVVMELGDFAVMRRMLRGIKERAERIGRGSGI